MRLHAKAVDALDGRLKTTKARDEDIDRAQIRQQIQTAIDEIELAGFADLLYDASTVLVEAGWDGAKALLDVSTGFDVVPTRTLEKVRDGINELVSLVEERERDAMRAVLEQGFEAGQSGAEVAKAIRTTFAEGYHRLGADGVVQLIMPTRAWSEMVARTEMATAATAGALDLYHEAGIEKLRWQASDPCPECAEYDDQVYPIDDLPAEIPLHPLCRCAWLPADDDLGSWRGTEAERELARHGNNPS